MKDISMKKWDDPKEEQVSGRDKIDAKEYGGY